MKYSEHEIGAMVTDQARNLQYRRIREAMMRYWYHIYWLRSDRKGAVLQVLHPPPRHLRHPLLLHCPPTYHWNL